MIGFFAVLCAAVEDTDFTEWPLSKAVKILNDSPWARVETFARVVGGLGSGVSGEKEIYYSFYVRFLSARPVREAYTRIQLIQHGYDEMDEEEKREFSDLIQSRVEADLDRWIVVAVSFRCNDPNEESRMRQFFQSATTATLKNKAFLVTPRFSQVPLLAYFAPQEGGVGARFVFSREQGQEEVLTLEDSNVTFELTDVPAAAASPGEDRGRRGRGRRGGRRNDDGDEEAGKLVLRATFSIRDMIVDGELEF